MFHKHRILVVDDNKEITDLLSDFLSRKGYEVTTASSAQQAFKTFKVAYEHQPELVLSDVQLGTMNGIEMTKILMEEHPGIAVVLFSAYGNRDLETASIESGAQKFLNKPFSLSEINRTVSECLDSSPAKIRKI